VQALPVQQRKGVDAVREGAVPPQPAAEASSDGSSLRPRSAVRIAVIDAADHMVYSDVRDRRGWQQPLSANEAVSEVRTRHAPIDGMPSAEPLTVKTVETVGAAAIADGHVGKRATEPTPYSVGKSRASNVSSASDMKRVTGAVKASPVPQPPTQAGNRRSP